MEAKVVWQGDMAFIGSADTGIEVKLDASAAVGGHDDGLRPLELLALGIGGCTAMDVISILKKKRAEISTFEVQLHIERAEEHPKVFTDIVIDYILSGPELKAEDVERAVMLSETKYCSSIAMFKQVARLSHRVIVNAA